jgi:hypothetical protein
MLEASMKMKLFYPVRPWENEPDHAEWVQYISGYKCRIVRNPTTGTLCGYVGIPKEHRFFGVGYDEDRDKELGDIADHVHGGLTYSAEDADGLWYFGFDTAHHGDFAPAIVELLISAGTNQYPPAYNDCMNYKTWEFVEDQIFWFGKRLWKYNEYAKERKEV